jgi:hypothetical protein
MFTMYFTIYCQQELNFNSIRRYSYFDVMVGLARSCETESYADGSLATVRAFHARQVKGDGPDKKGYPGPAGWRSVTSRSSHVRQSYPRG